MVANYCLNKIINNESLAVEEIQRLFQIMSLGGATPAMISAVLTGLKMKGYSEDELRGVFLFLNAKKVKILTDQKVFGFHVNPKMGIECFFTALVMAALGHACYIKFPKTTETNIYTSLGLNLRQTDDAIGYQISKYKIAASYAKNSSFLRNVREVKNELDFYSILDDCAPFVFNTGVYGSYVRVSHNINAELIAKVLGDGFQEMILIHNKEKMFFLKDGKLISKEMNFGAHESLSIKEQSALLRTNLVLLSEDADGNFIKDFCAMILIAAKISNSKEDAFDKIGSLQKSGSLISLLEDMIRESNSYSKDIADEEE